MSVVSVKLHRKLANRFLKDSVTFKDIKGVTKAGPMACKVVPSRLRGSEQQVGGRTTGVDYFDIKVPANTTISEGWRAHVTSYETEEVTIYHVQSVGGHTNEPTRRLLCRKIQS